MANLPGDLYASLSCLKISISYASLACPSLSLPASPLSLIPVERSCSARFFNSGARSFLKVNESSLKLLNLDIKLLKSVSSIPPLSSVRPPQSIFRSVMSTFSLSFMNLVTLSSKLDSLVMPASLKDFPSSLRGLAAVLLKNLSSYIFGSNRALPAPSMASARVLAFSAAASKALNNRSVGSTPLSKSFLKFCLIPRANSVGTSLNNLDETALSIINLLNSTVCWPRRSLKDC